MLVGIDWSITSPAWTILHGVFNEFHYFGKSVEDPRFFSHAYPDYSCNTERYIKLSEVLIDTLRTFFDKHSRFDSTLIKPEIYLEGYSYAAHGLVFNIAECTGIIKAKLLDCFGFEPTIVPSTKWKAAHGLKGNANKKVVVDYVCNILYANLYEMFDVKPTAKKLTTINDIADSYCIATWKQAQRRFEQ